MRAAMPDPGGSVDGAFVDGVGLGRFWRGVPVAARVVFFFMATPL
jgi:hypothetical protein